MPRTLVRLGAEGEEVAQEQEHLENVIRNEETPSSAPSAALFGHTRNGGGAAAQAVSSTGEGSMVATRRSGLTGPVTAQGKLQVCPCPVPQSSLTKDDRRWFF